MNAAPRDSSAPHEPGRGRSAADHLDDYALSEQRAIMIHRERLSDALGRVAGVETTILDWEGRASAPWRREKTRRDSDAQMAAIETYRRRLGREVSLEAAAREWVRRFAASWRKWWERQPESCPPLS